MRKVTFKEPVRGITDVVCQWTEQKITGKGDCLVLHFTKNIFWAIPIKLVKSDEYITVKLPNEPRP